MLLFTLVTRSLIGFKQARERAERGAPRGANVLPRRKCRREKRRLVHEEGSHAHNSVVGEPAERDAEQYKKHLGAHKPHAEEMPAR